MPKTASKPSQPRRKTSPRLYFLTNRMNALPVLSTGLLQPALGLSKVYDDLFTATPGRLPLWVGPCPANIESMVSGGRDGIFPVAFEIDPKRITVSAAPSLSADLTVGSERLGGSLPDCRCILPEIAVPVSSLGHLHFRSDQELRDFVSRDFANTDLSAVKTVVSPEVFDGQPVDLDRLSASLSAVPPGARLTLDVLRSADALAGAAVMLAAELPAGREWSEAIQGLLQPNPSIRSRSAPASTIRSLLTVCGWGQRTDAAAELDIRFVHSALSHLVNCRSTAGWVSSVFVDAVTKGALEGATDAERRDIEAWAKYASEVARADRQPMPLDDSGSIIRRALIVLLLRPDPERLVKSRSSSLQPGDEVLATAALMCGAFHGLSMLSKGMKSRSAFSSTFPALVSEWINGRAADATSAATGLKVKGSVQLSDEQPPLARLVVKVGTESLAERTVQPPDSLTRVFYKAKQLKLDINYDWELKAFRVSLPIGSDRQQVVCVSEGRKDRKGRLAIRFVSPCLRLGRTGLRREQAIDLLRRNGSMDLDCRFSVSEDEQYVVVQAEQLLDTMDIDELLAHLEHVAQVADDYEQVNGQADLF
jgi:hypothetical protein